jgi:transcriptional regulator with XRE-family HTH domain
VGTLRKSLGLSRAELARRCGLSESTIRNLETGRHAPTKQTLAALATVFPWLQHDAAARGPLTGLLDGGPLCVLGQQDCLQSHQQLQSALLGEGGHLPLSLVLSDPACALAFGSFRNHHSLSRRLWHDVARKVRTALGRQPLDVWAIACADGRKEVMLCEWLLACGLPGLRLLLMEQSVPLLTAAYQHALAKLGREPDVRLGGLQADLLQVPRYRLSSRPRRQLFCLLGPLLGLPDGDLWSVQQALLTARCDDLLLLGFDAALSLPGLPLGATSRERVTDMQPLLRSLVERPFRLLLPDLQSLQLSTVLDVTSCSVPASYTVEVRASVTTKSRKPRRYSVWRSHHYHPQALTESLQQEGWALLQKWQSDEQQPATGLHLYQRVRVDDLCASDGVGSYQPQARWRSQPLWTDDDLVLCQPVAIRRIRRRSMTLCRAVEQVRCQPVQPRAQDSMHAVGKRVARLAYLLL